MSLVDTLKSHAQRHRTSAVKSTEEGDNRTFGEAMSVVDALSAKNEVKGRQLTCATSWRTLSGTVACLLLLWSVL